METSYTNENTNTILEDFRDVSSVALKILYQIPDKNDDYIEFIDSMHEFIYELKYRAPEVRKSVLCWGPLTIILQKYIYDDTISWQKNIIDIYMGNA